MTFASPSGAHRRQFPTSASGQTVPARQKGRYEPVLTLKKRYWFAVVSDQWSVVSGSKRKQLTTDNRNKLFDNLMARRTIAAKKFFSKNAFLPVEIPATYSPARTCLSQTPPGTSWDNFPKLLCSNDLFVPGKCLELGTARDMGQT